MDEYESLSHTRWDCKYHVVFIPKCRRKALEAYCVVPGSSIFSGDGTVRG